MISIKKKSLYLWESLEFVVDLSTAHQLQVELHWTAQLSFHPMSAFSFFNQFFQFMCWAHLNFYENSSLNIETDLLHMLCIHSHPVFVPLEELHVLSFTFFSFSEIINGLSDKVRIWKI